MANNIPGTGGEILHEIPETYFDYHIGCLNLTPKLLIAIPEASTAEILEDAGCRRLHHSSAFRSCSVITDRIPVINIVESVDSDSRVRSAMMVIISGYKDGSLVKNLLWDDTFYKRDIGVLYYKIRRTVLKILRKLNAEKIRNVSEEF